VFCCPAAIARSSNCLTCKVSQNLTLCAWAGYGFHEDELKSGLNAAAVKPDAAVDNSPHTVSVAKPGLIGFGDVRHKRLRPAVNLHLPTYFDAAHAPQHGL
jgi:hypothetical protein